MQSATNTCASGRSDPARRGRRCQAARRAARRAGLGATAAAVLGAGLGAGFGAGFGAGGQEAVPGAGEPVPVPSGQQVFFLDTVQSAPGPEGLTIRFRFVAPAIAREGGTVGPEAAQADMEALCNDFAVPLLPLGGPAPAQIIVSLADRAVAFGEPAPEATQFFEAFVVTDGRCQWEAF